MVVVKVLDELKASELYSVDKMSITKVSCVASRKHVAEPIRIIKLLCLIGMAAGCLFSQTSTGDILGTITDVGGGVVPAAQVKVSNDATGIGWSVTSNDAGLQKPLKLSAGSPFGLTYGTCRPLTNSFTRPSVAPTQT